MNHPTAISSPSEAAQAVRYWKVRAIRPRFTTALCAALMVLADVLDSAALLATVWAILVIEVGTGIYDYLTERWNLE